MKNVLLVVEIAEGNDSWSWLTFLDGHIHVGGSGRFSAKDLFNSIKRRGIMDLCVISVRSGPSTDEFLDKLEACGEDDPWPPRPSMAWVDVDLCPYLINKKAALLRRFLTLYSDIWGGEDWESKVSLMRGLLWRMEDGGEPSLEDRQLVFKMWSSLSLLSKLRSHDQYLSEGLEREFELVDDERLLEG